MKIAIIGLRGIPALSGGVEHVIEKLAPLFAKDAEITVYCRKHYTTKQPKTWKGVKLRYLPSINSKHLEALSHTALATIDASLRNFDIVHFHSMGNVVFSALPRLFFKKTIVTLHGLDYEREKWGRMAKLFLKFSEWIVTFFPNRIVSCSLKMQNHLIDKYGSEAEFIPNGVDIIASRKLDKMKKWDIKKGQYILFLSRIVPEKGLHYLIEAFKGIKTKYKLLIVGDATHTEDYLKKCKKMAGNKDNIVFTGPLYGEDKFELFSNAYAFVLPSTIEGMPIVLLEAMGFGLCPLVSNIQENLDVIEDRAYSFENKNVKDLRSELKKMLANPKKVKEEGVLCKKLVRSEYQWPVIANKYFQLYKSIIK